MEFDPLLQPASPDTKDASACLPALRKPYRAPTLSALGSFGTRTLGFGGSFPDSNFGKQPTPPG
jgi:hypothetical protein